MKPRGTPEITVEQLRRRTPARRETDIQGQILTALNRFPGVIAWRTNSRVLRMPGRGGKDRLVRFGGMAGMADIIGFVRVQVGNRSLARFLAVEVKRPGETARPAQAAFLDIVRHYGGVAIVASSTEDIRSILEDPWQAGKTSPTSRR